MVFGDDTKFIRSGVVREGLPVFGARITPIQIVIIAVSMVLMILTALWLKRAKTGKAMLAVANDSVLAQISAFILEGGIDFPTFGHVTKIFGGKTGVRILLGISRKA